MGYHVEIDSRSGFCSGVIRTIRCAEKALQTGKKIYSLGAIVHNNEELSRLEAKGLTIISRKDLHHVPEGSTVLIRAHGEPPSTYTLAAARKINLLECTCPVVLQLQKKIKKEYAKISRENGQIVIFGKRGHAEVDGLVGQVSGNAIIIENVQEVEHIRFSGGPVSLFSQTTKSPVEYKKTGEKLLERIISTGMDPGLLKVFNTICVQVYGRQEELTRFAASMSIILFVAGKESSNGKVLFQTCKEANLRSYAIENFGDISPDWFKPGDKVGICGAASTPLWLMEQIAEKVRHL